jgi:hypothetical protein
VLEDGAEEAVSFEGTNEYLGRRQKESGRLVKGRLARGDYLLFRGFPEYRVEQTAADETTLAACTLVVPEAGD